jgi:hypothetical protein
MDKFSVKYLFILLTFFAHIDISSALPKQQEFQHIECRLEPVVRLSRQHGTHPRIPTRQGASTNWSGYIAATSLAQPALGSVSRVAGQWTVPTVTPGNGNTYCAIWVGIDGYTSGSVEQIGTEHDWINNQQYNYAWFEMYPQNSFQIIGFPVNNGDVISASVQYIGNNVFQLSLYNHTKLVATTIPTIYTTTANAARSSAEWIIEAPYLNTILPLSHFGKIVLNNCNATIKGVTDAINSLNWAHEGLIMETPTGVEKAAVSPLSCDGKSFSVQWLHQ